MLTTTLNHIRKYCPCTKGWTMLLASLGKTSADDEPLPLDTILASNGLDDALWVFDRTHGTEMLRRLFAADCAERVLHLFEAERPNDSRPREAIRVARDPNATPEELKAARAAESAASDAAWAAESAARAAARATARAAWAAESAASDAAWAAASAARVAARATARAARVAARAAWAARAARAAAWAAERAAQTARLRQYLEHGEAAAQLPWPKESV